MSYKAKLQVIELKEEIYRLRAALAMSKDACHYCSLPAEEWARCQHGFPGCARADDAMGCPHLGAELQTQELVEAIRKIALKASGGLTSFTGNAKHVFLSEIHHLCQEALEKCQKSL